MTYRTAIGWWGDDLDTLPTPLLAANDCILIRTLRTCHIANVDRLYSTAAMARPRYKNIFSFWAEAISRCYLATLAHSSSFPLSNHVFVFSMPPSEISFAIQLGQKNSTLIFQIFTPHVCTFASDIPNNVHYHIFLQKKLLLTHISASNDHGDQFTYASYHLIWHCENTPPSASSQLCEEIIKFSFHCPDSRFASRKPGMSLFLYVPEFLQFIKTLVCPRFFARLK